MRPTVLAVLTLLATLPLSAQLLDLPAEIPVARAEYGELEGHDRPRVASDGTDFLAVWTDRREAGKDVVYAARFTAGGTLRDPLGIRVADGFVGDVIWTGHGYLVVADTPQGFAILSLDAGGTLRERHSLTAYGIDRLDVALATNGENVLLVSASGVAVRLELDGTPLGRIPLPIEAVYTPIAVASNGSDYLIASAAYSEIVAVPVTSAGVVGPRAVVSRDVYHSGVAVESDGASYLIVWTARSVFAQSVDGNGAAIGARQTLHDVPSPGLAQTPRIAWSGGEYVVTHSLYLEVFETRTTARGEPLAPPRAYAFGVAPDVVAENGIAAFVWIERGAGVRAGVARSHNAFDAITVLSRGAQPQSGPELTRAGSGVVASWVEQEQIRIAPLGGEPQIVAEVSHAGPVQMELVADDTLIWVVWQLGATLYTRRYTYSLVPVDAAPHEFPSRHAYYYEWFVTGGDNGVLIASSNTLTGPAEIVATVLRGDGPSVIATDLDIAPEPLPDRTPAIAWNGSEYVVAWVHQNQEPWWQFPQPVPEEIRAVRVTSSGMRLDAAPVVVVERPDPTYLSSLRLARAHGGGVVIVWRDKDHLYATRFRGEARPEVHTIGGVALAAQLREIVPLSGGYALVSFDGAATALTLISDELVPQGEPKRFGRATVVSDAVAIGDALYLGYARAVHDPAFGGVSRAFVSHGVAGPRRRAVR